MHRLLRDIISNESISMEFQGIYDVKHAKILGFEALARGPIDTPLHSPIQLFQTAIQSGFLYELDALCRRLAIEQFIALDLPGSLFLNVSPMVLANPKYPQGELIKLAKQVDLSCDRIIIEISEQQSIISSPMLHTALQKYRNNGFKVALDDVGHSYSGLKHWSEIQPDIIKIDPCFVQGALQDPVKRAFIEMLVKLGRSTNAQIICEGVQKHQELELIYNLGLNCAQGHFLCVPNPNPSVQFPQFAKFDKPVDNSVGNTNTVKPLLTYPPTCDIDEKAGAVYKMLVANPKLQSVPVIKEGRPVGLVSRHHMMERFSDTYAHALYDTHSIDLFMDQSPVILDSNTTLDQASLYITQRTDEQFSQYFIITDKDQYLGLASSRDLLRHITEGKIEYARYANPLTLLPGNVPIDKEIDKLLSDHHGFELAYIDIDNFKPFNDVYGYSKGDQLIKLVAQVMVKHCEQHNTFVGHIGGDDFIILFRDRNSKQILPHIIEDFGSQSLQFFDQQAIENKGYYATSRSGERNLFPLVSISIAVVTPDIYLCQSHHDVSELASEAKKEAKKIIGNSVFHCRRQSVNQKTTKDTSSADFKTCA